MQVGVEHDQKKRNRENAKDSISIIGITDGPPFDPSTWSGSSKHFFTALKKYGCFKAGISGLPSKFISRVFQLKNFSLSYRLWRFKYHIDTKFYEAYTRKVKKSLARYKGDFTHTLQIYSHYDVPSIIKDSIKDRNIVTCAYQDGNLARLIDSPRGYPKIAKWRIKNAMAWEKKVFRRIDIIFTFSEWLRKSFIEDYSVRPEKIIVVGAGANMPIGENSKKKFDGKTILFIGIDFERKGGQILLEAFGKVRKKINDARLNIIGPASIKGLPDGVKNLGFISKASKNGIAKLQQAYSEASLFVMPSLYEPYGVVFLEAMAHGLPCIGTKTCAMPEIIDHGKTGFLIAPGDSEALAEKIVKILLDIRLAKSMGTLGRKKYFNSMTWDNVAKRVIEHLHNRLQKQ